MKSILNLKAKILYLKSNKLCICLVLEKLVPGFYIVSERNVCLVHDGLSEVEELSPWWKWKRSVKDSKKNGLCP